MKKIIKIILSIFILLGSLVSCDEDVSSEENQIQNTITSFSRTEISNLSSDNKKSNDDKSSIYVISKMRSSDKSLDVALVGLIITVDLVNKKAIFTKENEIGSITYLLVERESNLFGLKLAEINQNNNLRSAGWEEWVCAAGCVAEGFAMSLLDGPAPIMDAAAALYVYVCTAECNE